MSIQLPKSCDYRQQHIIFVFLEDELDKSTPEKPPRYVKLTRDQDPLSVYNDTDEWIDVEAPAEWQKKYGEAPPPDSYLYGIWAETLAPKAIPYDGPTPITPNEQNTIVHFAEGMRIDLTMAMLYVMIEGLGWRPGAVYESNKWPPQQEMVDFYHFYAHPHDDDPLGSLFIALSLLNSGPNTDYNQTWESINRLAREIEGVYKFNIKSGALNHGN